jgi:hypothetical protein
VCTVLLLPFVYVYSHILRLVSSVCGGCAEREWNAKAAAAAVLKESKTRRAGALESRNRKKKKAEAMVAAAEDESEAEMASPAFCAPAPAKTGSRKRSPVERWNPSPVTPKNKRVPPESTGPRRGSTGPRRESTDPWRSAVPNTGLHRIIARQCNDAGQIMKGNCGFTGCHLSKPALIVKCETCVNRLHRPQGFCSEECFRLQHQEMEDEAGGPPQNPPSAGESARGHSRAGVGGAGRVADGDTLAQAAGAGRLQPPTHLGADADRSRSALSRWPTLAELAAGGGLVAGIGVISCTLADPPMRADLDGDGQIRVGELAFQKPGSFLGYCCDQWAADGTTVSKQNNGWNVVLCNGEPLKAWQLAAKAGTPLAQGSAAAGGGSSGRATRSASDGSGSGSSTGGSGSGSGSSSAWGESVRTGRARAVASPSTDCAARACGGAGYA